MLTTQQINTIKNSTRIDTLVTEAGVTLTGHHTGTMKGLCPFHSEKTPSFTVRPTQNTYHCFGCGASGDTIAFLTETQHLTFHEAIQTLADRAGITIELDHNSNEGTSRTTLLKIIEAAHTILTTQYHALHKDHPAKKELTKRKLDHLGEQFGVGYAEQGWDHLTQKLISQGFTVTELKDAGVTQTTQDGKAFDLIRGRLTWTITNTQGKPIAFAGRKLYDDRDGPKYINSPATPIYNKSHTLYNLHAAKQHITDTQTVIVVEGYTDVMAYTAAGIHNVVATCGTAFGNEHGEILRRLLNNQGKIIFNFDSDEAGQKAAQKILTLHTPIHPISYAINNTTGLDPDELRQQHGNTALATLIETSTLPLTEHCLNLIKNKHNLTTPEGTSLFLNEAAPIISTLPNPTLRDSYMRTLALWTGNRLNTIQQHIAHLRNPTTTSGDTQAQHNPHSITQDTPINNQLRIFASIALQHPHGTQEAALQLLNNPHLTEYAHPTYTEIITLAATTPGTLQELTPDDFGEPQLLTTLYHQPHPLINPNNITQHTLRAAKNIERLVHKTHNQKLQQQLTQAYEDTISTDLAALEYVTQRRT